ncbi:MAG TPA: NTP transferase domain-containing protein [Allosphingosinicella sp.]
MKCLIIAAGMGTRLRSRAPSKPLAQLGGVPLLEHVIRLAHEGGATAFTVVTGYRGEEVEEFLSNINIEAPIETVRNGDWESPNGLSVLAAADRLDGEFLLLMSDHLFDPAIVRRLLAAPAPIGLTLAADFDILNPRLDIDDATKLDVDAQGRIIRIGKALEGYNAVDTGIFRATPALLGALRESVEAGGSGSLSEGVALLATRGQAQAFDIAGAWWLDVDDEAAFVKAEAKLRP